MSTPSSTMSESIAEPKTEVFLSPRVVDERSYRALADRLRELVSRAGRAEETLVEAAAQGAELLTSLEATAHTQSRRAREIRENVDAAERRLAAFDTAEVAERAAEVQRAGDETCARVEAARAALERSMGEAERRAAEIGEIATTNGDLSAILEQVREREASLTVFVERAENVTRRVRDAAEQVDGLQHQSESLLSAMRATILESAEARDAADARIDRLTTLERRIEAAVTRAEDRFAACEQRTEGVTAGDIDLDSVAREVEKRVMATLDARETTPRGRRDARAPEVEEALAEIRRSIELVSEVSEAAEQLAPKPVREIPAVGGRARRVAAPPLGASGEFGDPARTLALWSWGETN